MKKGTLYIGLVLLLFFASCKKDGYGGLSNNTPDVAITVSDLYGMYTYPTVSTSLTGGGAITIKLNISAGSGRTIKEITRVAAGTSGTNYRSVEITTGLYNTAVIAGSGTTATFTTTLTEYTAKTGLPAPTPAQAGTAVAGFLARYFFFLVTLDNGQTIIPPAVRVYVKS
jgi:hypothetical protein